jgi:hypothetical protein
MDTKREEQGGSRRLVINEDSVKDIETSETEVAHDEGFEPDPPRGPSPAPSPGRHGR